MKNYLFIILYCILFSSCGAKRAHDSFALQATDTYLDFPIDEETRLPKFCLWTFEENGVEYLTFNSYGNHVLFYEIATGRLVKKVKYETEGNHGVGFIYSFSATDFNHIYIADTSLPIIYVTDSTGQICSKIRYDKTSQGIPLIPTFAHTITYSPMCFLGDSLYLSQDGNNQLGDDFMPKSPLGVMIDRHTHKITSTPLKHIVTTRDAKALPYSTASGDKVSVCYNGTDFVYSSELTDSIYTLSRDFSKIAKHPAKSRYIKHPEFEVLPSDTDIDQLIKRKCELPSYGNLIYDPYRDVYYRFAFPKAEFGAEKNFMDIYHNGRKQFSIIILDKDMNVVGETLFPEYTYNAYLLFVRKDGLYVSATHFKRPDFDENRLRFQKIALVKL
ncbi:MULTISPECIES: DUF4221 family protein [Bacteroides]|uniref:DUF4221 family protein n=1 Tax=Bacteroides TaxID=816 RepID=UPI000694F2B9|nr:DUF4221 family protein [Bacteroides neonati]